MLTSIVLFHLLCLLGVLELMERAPEVAGPDLPADPTGSPQAA